jgi:addiction module RelE/StbE family toxin
MRYKAEYIELARQDVSEIKEYLSQFYPSTPAKFLTELKQSVEALRDNPFKYPKYEDHPAYRRMVVLDYLVFYKVFEPTGIVEIHRVLHGMRNIKEHLPKNQ